MARLIEVNGKSSGVASDLDPEFTHGILLEQLEYLCDHFQRHGSSQCSDCHRYLGVRSLLLEIFADPPAKPRTELTRAA